MFNRKLKQKIKMLEEELQASKEDCKAHQLMAESYRKDAKELKRELESSEKEIGELKSKISRKEQPRGSDGRFIKKGSTPFKVGDKVKIVDGFKPEKYRDGIAGHPLFTYEMDESIGREGVVVGESEVTEDRFQVDFGLGRIYFYHPDWLEHV